MNAFVLHSGPGAAAANMALDEALLEALPQLGRPVLRFYGWTEPAATFGYFQKHADVERVTLLRPLVRRPTGGGVVPHDADWTYSLTFPATHEWHGLRAEESYRRVHEWVRAAFAGLGVTVELATCGRRTGPGQCFAGWEESDVLWQGRKIAGAAQRRTCNGLLVQGSIQPPPMALARDDWQEAMCATAPAPFGVDWIELQPEAALMEAAGKLAGEKYARSAYNRKR